jgi:MoaA/NifB/PqqE/SkfB family radical SAM enzyme
MRFNHIGSYRHIMLSRQFLRTIWSSRRNALADSNDQPPPCGPYMAEFDITYRCNCRCRMCQRWKDPRPESLTVADYRRLAAEFRQMGVHQISVAGGEPLMRKDVFDIIRGFAEEDLSVNLCTNGLLVDRYARQIIASGATCVTVSLDGASAQGHDTIRGLKGSYKQVEAGILRLLSQRRTWRPILRVRMTVSNLNQNEIRAFFQKWKNVADDVLLQPVHHCGDSYYTGLEPADLALNPDVLADQLKDTPLSSDTYMGTFIESLRKTGAYPNYRCFAGVLMVRIDPWGNVYPCLEQHVKIGSIKHQSFQTLWQSDEFNQERKRLRDERPCRCWYNNTALIGHFGNLLSKTVFNRSGRRPAPKSKIDQEPHQPCYVPLKPYNRH